MKFTCEYIYRESMMKNKTNKKKPLKFSHTDSCFSIYRFSFLLYFPSWKTSETLLLFLVPFKWQFFILISSLCFLCSIHLLLCADTNPRDLWNKNILLSFRKNWSIKKHFQFVVQVGCWILGMLKNSSHKKHQPKINWTTFLLLLLRG